MATTSIAPYADLYLCVSGERLGASSREQMPVCNPATGAVIGHLPAATGDDVRHALEAAARGYARWRAVPAHARARILHAAATLVRERQESIARTMTLEQGKVIAESRLEVAAAADIFDWAAEEGRRAYGRVVPSRSAKIRQIVLREPVGPVAACTPWNFPALTPARKLAGALGAGCSIVIKPAEETPATAIALLEALLDAGVEPDAVSVVFGDPARVFEMLAASPVIRKISFTGSTAVGKRIARLAAEGVKRLTLELGGHAPVIVTARADVERAALLGVAAKFRNAGQVCVAPSRFIVDGAVYDEFVERFEAAALQMRVGDGLDESVQMGPLANARRGAAVEALVRDAAEQGATIRRGVAPKGGFFFAPTVVRDVTVAARALNEEPFGPIAPIVRTEGFDAAVDEANRLPYGLAAYAFTGSLEESIALSDRVETGMLGINHFGISLAEIPFGGVKESGYGSEGGSETLDAYLVTKSVTMT